MSGRKKGTPWVQRTFPDGTRICMMCEIRKSLEDFHFEKSRKLGRHFACKECLNTKGRLRYGTIEYKLRNKLYRHGLKKLDFMKMLSKQRGLCAICLKEKPLDIDHCHKTGKIRGLLCRQCNTALGSFKDNPTVLRRAIRYLGRK